MFNNRLLFQDKFESIHKQIKCNKIDKSLFENGTCIYKQLDWKTARFYSDFHLKPNVQITNIMVSITSELIVFTKFGT